MKFITILKNKFLDIPQSVKVSIILLICGILQRGISVNIVYILLGQQY